MLLGPSAQADELVLDGPFDPGARTEACGMSAAACVNATTLDAEEGAFTVSTAAAGRALVCDEICDEPPGSTATHSIETTHTIDHAVNEIRYRVDLIGLSAAASTNGRIGAVLTPKHQGLGCSYNGGKEILRGAGLVGPEVTVSFEHTYRCLNHELPAGTMSLNLRLYARVAMLSGQVGSDAAAVTTDAVRISVSY
jgi:hypothetical protein